MKKCIVPRKLVLVPTGSDGLVPVPLLPAALFVPRIRIPIVRDPKKLLMGVQIRIELSEKRTVPRKLVPVPTGSDGLVPVPLLPKALFVPRIRIPIVRDPMKLLMGVQIRIELSEKRTVPHKLVPIPTGNEGLVPVPVKVVPVPLLPAALFVHIFALLSSVFVYRLLGTLRND